MKYSDSKEVKVGDKVKLWDGCYGIVVCSIDTDEYTADYPNEEWEYLKIGVMIDSDKAGLVHYPKPDEALELIERALPRFAFHAASPSAELNHLDLLLSSP
jgi:hypothetical protein